MLINHIGIINETEEQAERFYSEFLGLEKTKEYNVPSDLSRQIFSVTREIKMLVFEKDGMKIEVFICPDCKQPSPEFRHMGLLLDDLSAFMEKAYRYGVEQITGKSKDKTVHFLKDFSGNLIEIKQK